MPIVALCEQIGEAYSVLSDEEKKKIYDQYGEEGLKGGVPFGGGDFGGAGAKGGARSFNFSNADAFNIFEQFFADMGGAGGSRRGASMFGGPMGGMPFGASMGGAGGGSRSAFGFGGMPGMSSMDYDGYDSNSFDSEPEKAPDAVIDLNLTLEELANGVTKKLRINRSITDARGATSKDSRTIEVPIKAGYKEGTKLRYEGMGDETPRSKQDVVFVVKQKPHPQYTREGDNLVYRVNLTLEEAILGAKISLPPFAGRHQLSFELKEPISSTYVHTIRGQGMPNSKLKTTGDLKIHFNILMPNNSFTDSQKEKIRSALSGATYSKK